MLCEAGASKSDLQETFIPSEWTRKVEWKGRGQRGYQKDGGVKGRLDDVFDDKLTSVCLFESYIYMKNS